MAREPVRLHLPAAQRRRHILQAARHLFAQRPYTAVTTAEVAEATGVTWGLVAHYFGDKRGLYLEVLRSIAHPERKLEISAGTLEERISQAVDAMLTTIERSTESWLAAVGGWDMRGDAEIEEIVDEGREEAVDHLFVAFGADVPATTPEKLRAIGRCAVALGETAAQEWLRQGHLTREEARHLVTRSILAMLDAATETATQIEEPSQ